MNKKMIKFEVEDYKIYSKKKLTNLENEWKNECVNV